MRVGFSLVAGSQNRLKIAKMNALILRSALIATLLTLPIVASSQENFLGEEANRSIQMLQEKADSDFAKGDYGSALEVYQHELAPLGDKYSQYMVGYMYLAGKGVQEDAILASAWYRLAAQRGTEQYVRIRDSLLALLNDEQQSRCDQLYIELRRKMGDLKLVQQLLRSDMQILRRRSEPSSFLQLQVDPGSAGRQIDPSDPVNEAAIERIASRVELLTQQMAFETTLDNRERITLTELIDDARVEIDAYNARH